MATDAKITQIVGGGSYVYDPGMDAILPNVAHDAQADTQAQAVPAAEEPAPSDPAQISEPTVKKTKEKQNVAA